MDDLVGLGRRTMKELIINCKLRVGDNTLLAVEGLCYNLKNGSIVYDEDGTPHTILSIGTYGGKDIITNLLIEGDFKSERLFI